MKALQQQLVIDNQLDIAMDKLLENAVLTKVSFLSDSNMKKHEKLEKKKQGLK